MRQIECDTRFAGIRLRWACPLLVVAAVLTSGCATGNPDGQNAEWSGFDRQYTSIDGPTSDKLDPITAIAAAQHPLSRQALQLLGIRYRYGGTSPDSGFDCSGLVHYSARESLGLQLPRRSVEIARAGKNIKRNDLTVGDLVFFNTRGARYSHVGIYLGSNMFVHAPASGGVVRVENMTSAYWSKRFNGARRIDPVMVANR